MSPNSPDTNARHATLTARAAKACSTCNSRKIRCDVLQTGVPCTKCKESKFQCSIKPRKKRRSKADVENPGQRDGSVPLPPRDAFPEHIIRHQIPHYTFFRNLTPIGRPSGHSKDAERGLILPISPRDHSADQGGDDSKAMEDDMRFLKQKGAFNLPPKAILDECVSSYFRVFHPFFPIVDRPSFLAKYWQWDRDAIGQPPPEPSLLLLQAIIFTSSAVILYLNRIIDINDFVELLIGPVYSNTTHSRHGILFTPASAELFPHKGTDDIVTIQALLLMSHYYPSMAEQRHTWFWVHQAIGLAQGAGLHRDSGQAPQRKLWARIWWACLIRDRLIALGTSRPMHINSLDCNVPLPTTEDLMEEGDSEDDSLIKAIFMDFVKLCHYMEGVLSLPFTTPESLTGQISVCGSTLRNWASNLSTASQRDQLGKAHVHSGAENIPLLYRSFLHLIHNTVLTALLQSSSSLYQDRQTGRPSAEVQAVAADSASLLDDLLGFGLMDYCPTPSVTTIIPPLIVQVMIIRYSPTGDTYNAAKSRFETCMTALEKLGHIYWHAKFYRDFFRLAELSLSGRSNTTREIKAPRQHHPLSKRPRLKDPEPVTASASVPDSSQLTQDAGTGNLPSRHEDFSSELEPAGTNSYSAFTSQDKEIGMIPPAPGEDVGGFSQTSPLGQLGIGEMTLLGSPRTSFNDWLDDDVLFQTLFPSA